MSTSTNHRSIAAGRISLATLLLLFFVGVGASAQNSAEMPNDHTLVVQKTLESSVGEIIRVKTDGGGEFQGALLAVADDRIEIRDGEGLILQISTGQITDVILIDSTKGPSTYYQDAAANKLIVIPLGFGMERGEFHISDQEIIAVNVSYGITEHISFWGGLSVPGMLLNLRGSISPKETIGISAGTLAVVTFIELGAVVIPYVISSFGSENENFTVGAGAPFVVADFIDGKFALGAAVVFGGKKVLSQKASLITENWVMGISNYGTSYKPETFEWMSFVAIPSIAFRIAASRFSWDIGITIPIRIYPSFTYDFDTKRFVGYRVDWLLDDPIPLPILGITYRIK